MTEAYSDHTLWEHLEELRMYLLRAVIGVVVCVAVAFFFVRPIIHWLAQPIGGLDKLQAIEVTENIGVYMKVAMLTGVIISIPWVFAQFLGFVSKGLKQTEQKQLYWLIPVAVLLFVGGAAFAFFILLPSSLAVLTTFLDVKTILRVRSYFDFLTNLVFWIALSFELPLIVFVLAKVRLVTSKMLWKGWRIAIVAIAVLAAVITPTADPVNMLIFMVPLFGLYLLSIGLAALAAPSRAAAEEIEEN